MDDNWTMDKANWTMDKANWTMDKTGLIGQIGLAGQWTRLIGQWTRLDELD